LPQGLPKKIQFNLLPADLALQLADALAGRRKILARFKLEHPKSLARPTGRPQRLRTPAAEMPTPAIQIPLPNPELAGQRGYALSRQHPLHRRKFELSAEHTPLTLGHRSLLENCLLFLCLIFGVHSRVISLFSLCYLLLELVSENCTGR
jgi:hypothetical protein